MLAAGAFAVGAVVAACALAFLEPSSRPVLPPDAEARGEAFERALAAAVTKVRNPAGEAWAIAVDPADINAWLATRLPKWIAHDSSLESFGDAVDVRLAAEEGALVVESPVGPASLGLVGTVRVSLTLAEPAGHSGGEQGLAGAESEPSDLRIGIGGARIGRLPVPLLGRGAAAAQALVEELARFEERYPDRRIRLADRRLVEVRSLQCEDGRIVIRFATLPAAASGQ